MRLLWLPAVLRAAGLTVHEYPGWQTRGSDAFGPLRGVVCHATAGSRTSTDAGEMRVLWETGSTSAPVPISQLYLSRSGAWTVGASGRCNHVLIGDRGPHAGYGNYQLLGIEAQNDNRGEPWSPVMLDSYQRGVAAVSRHIGWPASVVVAHREHQSDKSDPAGVDMTVFRARVAQLLAGPPEGDDDMPQADTYQLPAGFAFDEKGGLLDRSKILSLPLPVPGNGNPALPFGPVYLSAATYLYGGGSTRLVVMVHDGSSWHVNTDFRVPEGGRVPVPLPKPNMAKGWGYHVAIGRARKATGDTLDDAPTSFLVEIGKS